MYSALAVITVRREDAVTTREPARLRALDLLDPIAGLTATVRALAAHEAMAADIFGVCVVLPKCCAGTRRWIHLCESSNEPTCSRR